jgi:hypothetical protein
LTLVANQQPAASILAPDEYWISGVKKRGTNRHPVGGGPVVNLQKRDKGKAMC